MGAPQYAMGDPFSRAVLDPDSNSATLIGLMKAMLGGSLTTYAATFSAVGMSAAQDVFEIVSPSTHRVRIRKIILSQYSDFGDAQAELISVKVIRGYTTSGSGGSSATPVNFKPWGSAAASTVEINNTTVAQDGTGVVLVADAWNVAAGWWLPEPIWLDVSSRLVVRITAPVDSVTGNGTMIFDEVAV